MKLKRGLGIGLIFAGSLIVGVNATITGNVIGTSPQNYLGLLGIAIFFIGIFLFSAGTLEERASRSRLDEASPSRLKSGTIISRTLPEDVDRKLAIRIASGLLKPEEIARLDDAKYSLRNDGFFYEANLLNFPEYQIPLITGYGEITSGKRLAGAELRKFGFRDHALKSIRDHEFEKSHVYPGKSSGPKYIRINDLLDEKKLTTNKVKLEIEGDEIYRDGKPIQGLKIQDDELVFMGEQYTSREAAEDIQATEEFRRTNPLDPYVYFSEQGFFNGRDEGYIRRTLGARSADAVVRTHIRYPIEKVWIMAAKDNPIKIAIDGDIDNYSMIPENGSTLQVGAA